MKDQIWQSVRYLLIAGGAFLAGRGKISTEQVMPTVDAVMQIGGAAVTIATAGWGLYVRFRTKSVPEAVAARADVPTVDVATGSIEPATKFRG